MALNISAVPPPIIHQGELKLPRNLNLAWVSHSVLEDKQIIIVNEARYGIPSNGA